MFQIDKLIYREPNFLSKENCNRLINSFYKDEAMYETSAHAITKDTDEVVKILQYTLQGKI